MTPDRYHAKCHHRAKGMTCEQFDDLYAAVAGRCEICGARGEETPNGMLFLDHDYSRGYWAVRGLLCNSCNTLLGRRKGAFSRGSEAYLAARPWHEGRLIRRRQGQRIADGHIVRGGDHERRSATLPA